MRRAFAALILAGIGWSSGPAAAQSTPGQTLHLTELSSTLFLPLQSSTSWTTQGPNTFVQSFGRYPNGGDIATLAVALDSSRIPDGAHLRRICFYWFDGNPDVDMTSLILESWQSTAGGATGFGTPVGWNVSSGAPGYGASCFDLDLPLRYRVAGEGGNLDLVDYVLAVGFGIGDALATDGSISLQRVALYWTKAAGQP